MRLTKKEKELLFNLTDVMTDRDPSLELYKFDNDHDREIFWSIFKKLRLELKGF